MLYVSKDKLTLMEYIISHPLLKMMAIPNLHFSEMESYARTVDFEKSNFYTFETILMDYVDPHLIKYIISKHKAVNFAKLFSDELEYMSPGEVLLNCTYGGKDAKG